MLWLALNHPEAYWNNVDLFVSVGSWKDIFEMLSLDLQYHGWEGRKLDWTAFGKLILAGLENPNTSELVKKYLPHIKTDKNQTTLQSQAKTIVAKWIKNQLFGDKKSENDFVLRIPNTPTIIIINAYAAKTITLTAIFIYF